MGQSCLLAARLPCPHTCPRSGDIPCFKYTFSSSSPLEPSIRKTRAHECIPEVPLLGLEPVTPYGTVLPHAARLTLSPHLSPQWGQVALSFCCDPTGNRTGIPISRLPRSRSVFAQHLLTPSSRWAALQPTSVPALTRRASTCACIGQRAPETGQVLKDIHNVLYAHAASSTGIERFPPQAADVASQHLLSRVTTRQTIGLTTPHPLPPFAEAKHACYATCAKRSAGPLRCCMIDGA
jgi:hypothetical protein